MLMPVLALQVFAQTTKQITEDYLVTGPWTDYVVPMKYSYTVSDEGERIMNGPISISGKQNEVYGNVTISGNYLLNASAKNGKLNGPMSVTANYHGVKKLRNGQKVEDYSYSLSGGFIDGLPNGTFTAKATNFGTSTVTYKKGVLVGAYNVNESIDDRIVNIKGSLNNDGKMVGTWQISILGDASVWEFVNGVRIIVSSKNQESTPKQIEMAKKYASGAITEKQLEAEGYFPVQDSICLGDYASDIFFLKVMANWDKLPGRDFKSGYWVKYTYLYNILPLPESEFEKVITNYKAEGKAPLVVEYDKTTNGYTTHYYVDYGTPHFKLLKRRFSNEQVAQIKEALDYYCRQNPITISDILNDWSLGNMAVNLPSTFEALKKNPRYDRYESLIENVNELSKAIKERLEGKALTSDGLFYILPFDDSRQPLSVRYFPVSTLNDFYATEKEIRDYRVTLNKLKEEEVSKNLNQALNGIEMLSKSKLVMFLKGKIVRNGTEYYTEVPHDNTISIEEFAEAIAPVTEYKITSFQKENCKNGESYQVIVEFMKKQKKDVVVIPVSMSVTEKGAKIIDKTISIVSK